VASNPPPWRMFDAPSGSVANPDPSTPASSVGTPAAVAVAGLPKLPARAGFAMAIGGAAILGALAIAIALGSVADGGASDTTGASGQPSGSDVAFAGQVVVDVGGAVARPGVYHLSAGSRVGDAIAAAGGFGPRVAADRVGAELNLAAAIRDGDRILVPSRDDPAPGPTGGSGGQGGGAGGTTLIDLNDATAEQLDSLSGIGPVTADKIIASRTDAPFKTVDELRERGLVGQKTFDKIRAQLTVG
jgi:competence protein ComEA